jgi:Kef-type K+ transport system membrane component KefB
VQGFGFQALALLTAVGFAGPLLAAVPRLRIPVTIGELIAGLVIGKTGFNLVDDANPTFQLFANIGFALVMFVVGSHVPVRDPKLPSALPLALARAVLAGAVSGAIGFGLATAFGTGHAALYAVLMASSSAAMTLPMIDSLRLQGPQVLSVTAQIAIANTAGIVLLPLVIDFRHAPTAALGGLAVTGCAVVVFVLMRAADRTGWRQRMHDYSHKQQFALELRTNLLVLFGLAALAVSTDVSIMLAGFALGLVIASVGEPRRLARQLFGITEGFFGPLFFVWLGASLQVRELGSHPKFILLGVGLGLGGVLAHCAGRLLGQPLTFAVMSCTQLGVSVAAATIGTQKHLLAPGEASALMFGALLTIACTSIAGTVAARAQSAEDRDQPAKPAKSTEPGKAGKPAKPGKAGKPGKSETAT